MPTYLFDVLLRGIVEADNPDQAREKLEALSDEDGHIYIDEYADIMLMKIQPLSQKDDECENQHHD